jgi:hypothetical protein
MTAAPANMVAIKISCPGQSTKLICLYNSIFSTQPSFKQAGKSSFEP